MTSSQERFECWFPNCSNPYYFMNSCARHIGQEGLIFGEKGATKSQIVALRAAWQEAERQLVEWKQRVIDQLVLQFNLKPEHENNPQLAIRDMIAWEQMVALDPAVSEKAQSLIDRGRQQLAQDADAMADAVEDILPAVRHIAKLQENGDTRCFDNEYDLAEGTERRLKAEIAGKALAAYRAARQA